MTVEESTTVHVADALEACGIEIVERVPHAFEPNGVNDSYLATKAQRFGHFLE